MDTNIKNNERPSTSLPQSTTIKPLEVPTTMFIPEMVHTSDILENTSHVDSNVNIGGKSTIDSLIVTPQLDSPLKFSLHQFTFVPQNSPTCAGMFTHAITSFFSSQCTDHYFEQGKDISQNMEDEEDEGFGFGKLTFDLEEEDIADEALMSGKQY
ncbi:unnamed protein product [Lactuca saligna]|uniref:Uncharacterized protein n=1 Tax=Lactuca saligna TaxID=75948 RepID=A0AA36ECI7_LACSI|nr:unnamed protein product [Lactuca saligna]